jgi:hypothetical protein
VVKQFIAVVALIMTMALFAVAQTKDTQAAQSAAEKWLTVVDKGDYAASWDEAAAMFKSAVTKGDWEKAVGQVRGSIGKFVSRKLKGATYATSLPGAPDGEYVVIQYDSSFENKKAAVETVTMSREKDGVWRTVGYFVK